MRDNGSGNGAGWASLLLGTVALLMAVFQPVSDSTQRGFLASTVGITAIAYGLHALKKRRAGRATSSVAPRVGILFGTVGTAVMVYSLAAFLLVLPSNPMTSLVAGLHLPGVTPQTEPASAAAQAPLPVVEQPVAAALPPPASAPQAEAIPASTQQQEWAAVVQAAGTLAFVMNRITPAGHSWPASLAVTTDNRRVMTPTGVVLGTVPPGADLSYQPSADLGGYTLTVTGSTFGVIAEFSSYTGEVTTR